MGTQTTLFTVPSWYMDFVGQTRACGEKFYTG